MYNKLLNHTFDFFSSIDRSKAFKIANSLVSPSGVKNTLTDRLEVNEGVRYKLFKESFTEDQLTDPLLKFEQNVKGKYRNNLIDAGEMNTQLYKANLLKRMRFAEYYNSYTTDKDNFRYYKLKYAYNFGEFERNAFKFQEIEDYKNNGNFGSHFKKYDRRIPDYPVL